MPFVVGYLPLLGWQWLAGGDFHGWIAIGAVVLGLVSFDPGYARHRRPAVPLCAAMGMLMVCGAVLAAAIRVVRQRLCGRSQLPKNVAIHQRRANSELLRRTAANQVGDVVAAWIDAAGRTAAIGGRRAELPLLPQRSYPSAVTQPVITADREADWHVDDCRRGATAR